MDFEIKPATDAGSSSPDAGSSPEGAEFHISTQPLVTAAPKGAVSAKAAVELPRSYGTQTLCLMARDPHTLFVYWDIDWDAAFREQTPPDRKVHLRILNADGSEQAMQEVEPLATSCSVAVSNADAGYTGEIGWFKSPGVWSSLAHSDSITTPADANEATGPMELMTIPFHLSFQRMLDLLRVPKHESGSLAAMLGDLRERVKNAGSETEFSEMHREVIRAIEEVAANSPASGEIDPNAVPLSVWTRERLERMLGFGPSSPSGGFVGSSRPL